MTIRSGLLCGVAAACVLLLPALAVAQDNAAASPQAAAAGGRAAQGGAGGAAGARGRGAADIPPSPAVVVRDSADTRLADAAARQDRKAVLKLLMSKGVNVDAFGRDGSTALLEAVRYGDTAMAAALIEHGADAKRPNRYGISPLILAATDGAAPMMKLLIDHGADANGVDPAGETALMAASRSGAPEAVAVLLDHGAKIDAKVPVLGETALMIAAREDRPAVVELLIKRGADVNARNTIGPAPVARPPNGGAGSHGEGIVRGGVPPQGARAIWPGGMTPLLFAARDGREQVVKILLDRGAKIELADANDLTPLLMALLNGKLTTARLLIERGANVNARDWYGRTPLWSAVEARDMEVDVPKADNGVDRPMALELIKTLLDKGADPNARTKEYPPDRRFLTNLGSLSWVDFTGQTAFVHAALSGDVTTMKLLLQYKADPNIPTFSGTTALAAASGVNYVLGQTWTEGPDKLLEAVKLCVDLGQDVNAANDMGLAPVHGAANRGSDDIITYLVSKGAKLDAKDKVGRTPLIWAGGIFLASAAPSPKPSTQALIKDLLAKQVLVNTQGLKNRVADAPAVKRGAPQSNF